MSRYILTLLFLLVPFLLLVPGRVYATDKTTVSVSPAILDLRVNPGTSSTSEVTIFNLGATPQPLSIQSHSFTPLHSYGDEFNSVLDASSWIATDFSDLILQPSENKKVQITVTVPNNAEPGGHYATIYFQPRMLEQDTSTQDTFVNARLGVLVFITVFGNMNESATLDGYKIDRFNSFGPKEITLDIKNTGNVHIMPKGSIKITNIFGKMVREVQIPPNIILPNNSKTIDISTADLKLWPGIYKASIGFYYGSSNLPSQIYHTNFVVYPAMHITIASIVLTVLIYICILNRERFLLAVRILFGGSVDPH